MFVVFCFSFMHVLKLIFIEKQIWTDPLQEIKLLSKKLFVTPFNRSVIYVIYRVVLLSISTSNFLIHSKFLPLSDDISTGD